MARRTSIKTSIATTLPTIFHPEGMKPIIFLPNPRMCQLIEATFIPIDLLSETSQYKDLKRQSILRKPRPQTFLRTKGTFLRDISRLIHKAKKSSFLTFHIRNSHRTRITKETSQLCKSTTEEERKCSFSKKKPIMLKKRWSLPKTTLLRLTRNSSRRKTRKATTTSLCRAS